MAFDDDQKKDDVEGTEVSSDALEEIEDEDEDEETPPGGDEETDDKWE